jgi:hypothetical protein
MLNRFFIALLAFTIFFSSCTDDEVIETGKFETGTFIVNQGTFGAGTGTITFSKDNEVIEDVYAAQNPGLVLGNIAQAIHKFNGKYYISVNNAAKIVLVESNDFKFKGEIKLDLPRYFESTNNKLYVTSWKNDFQSGFINLIDETSLSVKKSVPVNGLAEKMVLKNDLLYVIVSAPYGTSRNDFIVVYDTQKDEIKESIKVGDNPNDLVFDKNGDLWVICSGYSFNDATKNTAGSLQKITGNKSVFAKPLSNGANGLVTNSAKNKVYYMADGQVFEFDLSNTNTNPKSITNGFYYTMGLDAQNDQIYLADAKDFVKKGEIKVIDTKGNVIKTVPAGVIPGFVYFSK